MSEVFRSDQFVDNNCSFYIHLSISYSFPNRSTKIRYELLGLLEYPRTKENSGSRAGLSWYSATEYGKMVVL